jgi:hypothetical protein
MKSCPMLEKAYQAEYYKNNIEKIKEQRRQYYQNNKAAFAARGRASRAANPELTKLVDRLIYERTREDKIARSKARYWKLKKEREEA